MYFLTYSKQGLKFKNFKYKAQARPTYSKDAVNQISKNKTLYGRPRRS